MSAARPTPSGATPRTELGLASHRVKTLPGAVQDGSGEVATSSGCARLTGERHSWPHGLHPGPLAGQSCPRTAGTIVVAGAIVVAGTQTLPGDWLPTSCPPSQNGPQEKNIRKHYRSGVLEEARRSLLGASCGPEGRAHPLPPQSPAEPRLGQPTLPQSLRPCTWTWCSPVSL